MVLMLLITSFYKSIMILTTTIQHHAFSLNTKARLGVMAHVQKRKYRQFPEL